MSPVCRYVTHSNAHTAQFKSYFRYNSCRAKTSKHHFSMVVHKEIDPQLFNWQHLYINTKASFSLKQYWHFTGISLHPTSNRHQMSKCTIFNCFPHNRVVSCSSVCIIIIQFCSVVNKLPSLSAYKMIQFFQYFFTFIKLCTHATALKAVIGRNETHTVSDK